ncbi:MAG: AAA family ATPase [Candidatus Hatepunaea meridiana]|nr:AAA family ATPase [Candidatus Hatepunaea meridiana]
MPKKKRKKEEPVTLTKIKVKGFKCFRDETEVEIRPLTVLAGANSSGKTSIMQPLLLMKQTLLAPVEPAHPLLLDGANVKFNLINQLYWLQEDNRNTEFTVELNNSNDLRVREYFTRSEQGFSISRLDFTENDEDKVIYPGMTKEELKELVSEMPSVKNMLDDGYQIIKITGIVNNIRCMLVVRNMEFKFRDSRGQEAGGSFRDNYTPFAAYSPILRDIIHIPEMRGNPERYYTKQGVSGSFSGWFQNYIASLLLTWQNSNKQEDQGKLHFLTKQLELLGLGWKIFAKEINDVHAEILISRLPSKSKDNHESLINIADVGAGVKECLPVLIALLTAKPGQIVYIEQPEIHLHPRAQFDLAGILADAAKRGVIVIAETHSDLLLLGIRYYVAKGLIASDKVKLHWFERDENGAAHVDSADIDENGKWGQWRQDFDDVYMEKQRALIEASLNSKQLEKV